MSTTPESVKELLESEDYGDRLQGLNQLRQLNTADAFELIQTPVEDRNVRVRYAAVSQLGSIGEQNREQAFRLLKAALFDPEIDVQAAAADSIAALKLTDAYPDLERLYRRTSEWMVQLSIIAGLGELGNAQAFDLLAEALKSEHALVQTAAIGSLGELGDPRAVELLMPFMNDPDWQIRHRLAQALSQFNTPEAQSALETLSQDPMEQVAAHARFLMQST
jgi:HEAT repeat protein